jgi:hypothetical protein
MRKRQRSLMGRALAFALVAPLVAAVVGGSASGCSVDDQKCPDDTIDTDLADDCPYGPPGGPQKPQDSCPSIVFTADDPACADVTFDTIFDVFGGPPGNCTALGCHATEADAQSSFGVQLIPEDPVQVYTRLAEYTNRAGEPYMAENNARSWILCNLKALPGGGSPMPKPGGMGQFPEQLAAIEQWVLCGMKPPVGGGPSSSASSSSGGEGGSGEGGEGVGGAAEGGAGGAAVAP